MKLTDKACKNAKPEEKSYKRFDGGGLFLEIMPNGSKLWRQKYYYLGKKTRIAPNVMDKTFGSLRHYGVEWLMGITEGLGIIAAPKITMRYKGVLAEYLRKFQ